MIRNGARTSRDISRQFEKGKSDKLAQKMRGDADKMRLQTSGLLNNAHSSRWEKILCQLPDGSINATWADPIFTSAFHADGHMLVKNEGGILNKGYDDTDPAEARKTLMRLFVELRAKHALGAPLFLHQHGGRPDDWRLLRFAEKLGWVFHCPLEWYWISSEQFVGSASPEKMARAFASVTQRILVATHGDYPPRRVGIGCNTNIYFESNPARIAAQKASHGTVNPAEYHAMEHSPKLVEEFVGRILPKDSHGLVFEPYACTAPASVAAIRNGWNWVCCESYAPNFELTRQRIARALEEHAKRQSGVADANAEVVGPQLVATALGGDDAPETPALVA